MDGGSCVHNEHLPNVYLDISLQNPFVGHGVERIISQVYELAPFDKSHVVRIRRFHCTGNELALGFYYSRNALKTGAYGLDRKRGYTIRIWRSKLPETHDV